MNGTKRIVSMEKIRSILNSVSQLRMTLGAGGEKEDAALEQIWDITQELQKTICDQTIVENFKQAAINQVTRVAELVRECGKTPNELQFKSLGYACDLAAERIREYQRMFSYAAQLQELENEDTTEEA